jgi:L-threonylcarbamoyladenylate synthase
MPTPIWSATTETLAAAAAILQRGGLVAFPTETVYGLGANALDTTAVANIFAAKGRPSSNPVIVHVASLEQVRPLVSEWPPLAQRLAERFWPGPLTIVVPRSAAVPDLVTAGGPTVAIRCPNHPVALSLLRAAGLPLAAPSANRSTELSPTRAEHVRASLEGRIEAILDGGPCQGGIESTVVDVSGPQVRLLRPGLISQATLESIVGPVVSATRDGIARSPGLMAKHYCPRTPLVLVASAAEAEQWCVSQAGTVWAKLGENPATAAQQLYALLHDLDAQGWQRIVLVNPPDEPEWAAVRDRLGRAASE